MARDDDPWRRFREREDEQEEAGSLSLYEKRIQGAKTPVPQATHSTDKLDRMMEQALMLIEEIGAKYNMYVAGIETLPPIERRKVLERLMAEILSSGKPTQASQFKVGSLNATYQIHKDKWDRTMRDLESGKIQRRGGPGRRRA